jgi:hypothetical protein
MAPLIALRLQHAPALRGRDTLETVPGSGYAGDVLCLEARTATDALP